MNERLDWNSDQPPSEAQAPAMVDWWGLWVRRKGLIFFGIVVSFALTTVYFFQATPIYESVAEVYIVERVPPTVPVEGIDGSSRYGRSEYRSSPHDLIIASPLIVGQAIESQGLMQLPSFSGLGYTSTELINEWLTEKQLAVYPVEGNRNVLELSFRSPNPEDSAAVLRAVIGSYERFLGDAHQSVGIETAELIRKAKDDLMEQLTTKEAEYARFRQEAPLLWKDERGTNFHVERQAQIEQTRAEVLLRKSQLQARMHAVEGALARGDDPQALLLLISQLVDKPLTELRKELESPLHNHLLELMVKEKQMLEMYGAEHPRVKTIQKQVELARQYVKEIEAKAALGTEGDREPVKFVNDYLQSIRDELAALTEQQRQLDDLFAQEQQNAKELTTYLVRDSSYRHDLQRTQQLFEATVKRLEEINIVKDYGTYNVRVISQPELGEKVWPAPLIVFGIAGVLGAAGGLSLAYVVDMADRTFRSPRDVTRHLQLPLVGQIPLMSTRRLVAPGGSKVAPILCAYHQPNSPLAEAYRSVRTTLYFSSRGRQQQVIQVTSPTPGDGKSTLAANLAVTMADSGKRVLLLDADFRRPTQHKLFGLHMRTGLADVIAGVADPQEAVQQCEIENLWLMPCGPLPSNPSELLTSPRFEELLALLREQYDFVIVDTPPMLAVSDPAAVAARVDGVLLALRIERNARPQAVRAAEMLADVGADVLGVVVNALNEKQHGDGDNYYSYRPEYGSYFENNGQSQSVRSNGKQLQQPLG